MVPFSIRLFLSIGLIFFQVLDVTAETAVNPKNLVFSQIQGSSLQIKASRVLKALYKRIGINAQFMTLPGRRALQSSNAGLTDGEIFRVEKIGLQYENLIKVPTSYMSFRGFAYSANNRKFNDWNELKGLRVGIHRGVVWAEQGSKGLLVTRFDTNSTLAQKLFDGGIDVAVSGEFSFEKAIEKNGSTRPIVRGEAFSDQKVFHYLNKKYKHLVPIVDREVKNMLSTGEVDRLLKISNIDWCIYENCMK